MIHDVNDKVLPILKTYLTFAVRVLAYFNENQQSYYHLPGLMKNVKGWKFLSNKKVEE